MRRLALSALAILALLAAVLPAAAGAASPNASERAQQALQRVQDLFAGVGVRTGREMTPALRELDQRRGALGSADRKKADSLLARPTDTESAPGHAYTVAEHAPLCTTHFCIHYVTSTVDAPDQTDANGNGTPDYVDLMAQVFENEVFPCENTVAALACASAGTTGLGWPQAPNDGTLGGNSKFDVYIEDLFPSGVFGYVAPDSQPSSSSLHSYLVMDKDFSRYSNTLTGPDEMRVTAAHEYNHVLQFGIDAFEDTWMFESTATFFENEVYPAIDDYLGYMSSWVNATAQPLTDAGAGGGLKIYGSAVWNHFLAGRHGAGTILAAWQAKTQVNGGSFAPASYDTAIKANGGTGFSDEFDDFSAAVAEWRAPNQGFPDLYPDVPAASRPTMNVGAAAASITLNHTTFAFRNVPVPATPSTTLTLTATLPVGLKGAIALVGRTGGSPTAGTVTKSITRTSNGGTLLVTLPNADTYGRITAVFVNADPSQSGFNNGQNDWTFTKDNQSFQLITVTASANGLPAPSVSTDAPSDITTSTATLNATVNPNGQPTTYSFVFNGNQTVPASAGSGTGPVTVSAPVTGLAPGSTVQYHVVATSAGGTSAGSDRAFATLGPPDVTTGNAGAVSGAGALLTGTVNAHGKATTFVFDYGTSTAYGQQATGSAGSATSPVSVSSQLTGLTPGTTYHFRIRATNADGTGTGSDQTFTTPAPSSATTTTTTTATTTASPTTTSTTTQTADAKGALALALTLSRAKLAAALTKGMRVRVGCGEPCTVTVKLVLPARTAARLGLRSTVATGVARPGSQDAFATVRFTKAARRALARLTRVKLTAVVSAVSADGRRASLKKALTIAR